MIDQKIFVGTDIAVFRNEGGRLLLLLIQRKNAPFKGAWCLPGGFLENEEAPEAAALRELQEETGLHLETAQQLRAFGRPDRDPRFRVISIAHAAWLPPGASPDVQGGDDAAAAQWLPVEALPELGFDHAEIVAAALEWARAGKA